MFIYKVYAQTKSMNKLFLYLSAFTPMYILLALKLVIDLVFGNLSVNVLNILSLILLISLFSSGIFGILYSLKKIKTNANTINIVECTNSTDQQFFNYFSLFVLFSLTYQIEFVSMFCVFIVILIFIGLVYIRNNLNNINPLLNICGYSYYQIVYTMDNSDKKYAAKVFYKGKLHQGTYLYCNSQKISNFILIKDKLN